MLFLEILLRHDAADLFLLSELLVLTIHLRLQLGLHYFLLVLIGKLPLHLRVLVALKRVNLILNLSLHVQLVAVKALFALIKLRLTESFQSLHTELLPTKNG